MRDRVSVPFTIPNLHTQHNMWSYFFFRTYLYGKDPLTFTGPEHYAFQVRTHA